MSVVTRVLVGTGVVVMAMGALVFAQGGDAAKVMADVRAALGGEKLAAITTLSGTGTAMRAQGETSIGGDYEFAMARPDKYVTRQVVAQLPMGNVVAKMGFNGDGLIQDTEQPTMPGGGLMQVRIGGAAMTATPEEQADAAKRQIATSKQEFARLSLGMFGAAPTGYPLEFTYGGTAEAPDGTADVIAVKGPDGFAGKLFVDQKSHLPLMFSWMGKEPMMVSAGGGGRAGGAPGGQIQTFTMGARGNAPTPEARDQMMKDMDARMKAAEANRKTVEFRVYYGDYKKVDGLTLPHKFQQSVAGAASQEITIDKYKVNPKLDAKQFEIVK